MNAAQELERLKAVVAVLLEHISEEQGYCVADEEIARMQRDGRQLQVEYSHAMMLTKLSVERADIVGEVIPDRELEQKRDDEWLTDDEVAELFPVIKLDVETEWRRD